MSQFNTLQLLATLKNDLSEVTSDAKKLYDQIDALNAVPSPGKWSIAQVLQHLNFYHEYYLPEIEKAFANYPKEINNAGNTFTTGIIGGYLTKMMQPDTNGKVTKKAKAFKDYIPAVELDARLVLDNFIAGQERFSTLLYKAQYYNWNKVRVTMSISSLIRLKLGDILRVLVIHQQRHFIQIAEAQRLIAGEGQFPEKVNC